ncbi:hypothetical protein CA13_03140 [Planctomycetes bacterium CA13]|uniref:Uncharacterized protein n=1 Tax=Novipirellula herctigrandis TaxID=2527986 RepID=A0A5C5YWJ2_9BACT|nr:hypothetical protein CA13_03140 [Planctomycetes bacterium CA13]
MPNWPKRVFGKFERDVAVHDSVCHVGWPQHGQRDMNWSRTNVAASVLTIRTNSLLCHRRRSQQKPITSSTAYLEQLAFGEL